MSPFSGRCRVVNASFIGPILLNYLNIVFMTSQWYFDKSPAYTYGLNFVNKTEHTMLTVKLWTLCVLCRVSVILIFVFTCFMFGYLTHGYNFSHFFLRHVYKWREETFLRTKLQWQNKFLNVDLVVWNNTD